MRTLTMAVLVVVVLGGEAAAQVKEKAKKPEVLTYDGSEVVGDQRIPNFELVAVKPGVKFRSQIKVRVNFNDKVMQSQDNL